tara:strand:+ start:552 stop:1040 length:489 start_codon:yes stop_codon:yes gene_type:complete
MESIIKELYSFLGKAVLATYAGSGKKVVSQKQGFKELEYKEDSWYYRDSYSGFFQSWGQSVVYYKNKPFWTELYGGGMKKKYHNNYEFSNHTFGFLKGALSAGAKMNSFNPRGPKSYKEGELEYLCMWKGNIKKFNGNEKILYKGNVVFTHDFVGGLILSPS